MQVPFVYRRPEGQIIQNGINWNRDSTTRLQVILRLWRFMIGVRWRSAKVGGKRVYGFMHWYRPMRSCGMEIDFDTRSLLISGVRFSYELLDMMANPRPDTTFRFIRHGNMLTAEIVNDPVQP